MHSTAPDAILVIFVLGNFWGFIESFLFLYLKELGAPNYLLGEFNIEVNIPHIKAAFYRLYDLV